MMDLDFEKRVRAAAHSSVDAVRVPAPPASLRLLRLLRPGVPRRRSSGWLWTAAAAAAIALTIATDGGRATIAYAVEQTMKVFSVDPDSGKRIAISTITLQEALSTSAFAVVVPRGLPSGARLLSIQRIGDPETGRPSVVFHYTVDVRTFDILENGAQSRVESTHQVVRASASMPEPRNADTKVAAPSVAFRTGRTQVTVSFASGALADAQIAAIRTAMTASSRP